MVIKFLGKRTKYTLCSLVQEFYYHLCVYTYIYIHTDIQMLFITYGDGPTGPSLGPNGPANQLTR
jgi:hypothetical protein